jgi:hypothetical protein
MENHDAGRYGAEQQKRRSGVAAQASGIGPGWQGKSKR